MLCGCQRERSWLFLPEMVLSSWEDLCRGAVQKDRPSSSSEHGVMPSLSGVNTPNGSDRVSQMLDTLQVTGSWCPSSRDPVDCICPKHFHI